MANTKWKTSAAEKLNRKQKQKLEVKMEETDHKNEEERKQTEEEAQVGEDMTEEGWRRRHVEQPIENKGKPASQVAKN